MEKTMFEMYQKSGIKQIEKLKKIGSKI